MSSHGGKRQMLSENLGEICENTCWNIYISVGIFTLISTIKMCQTELIYYEMPFHISLLKHPLWQMAEDWKVKHGILNVKLLNIWKIFLSEKEEERKVNICRCHSFSFILSWQSILPGKSAKGILILIDYYERRQVSLPYYTCTDHLFAAPSGGEQPDGEGSHQHTHLHHLCWSWTNEQSK